MDKYIFLLTLSLLGAVKLTVVYINNKIPRCKKFKLLNSFCLGIFQVGDIMNKYEVNIYEQIALNIKKYRKMAGITQAVLAEKVGVSHEFIRRIESKKGIKTFSIDTIWKISLALDVDPGKLFEIDIDGVVNS